MTSYIVNLSFSLRLLVWSGDKLKINQFKLHKDRGLNNQSFLNYEVIFFPISE